MYGGYYGFPEIAAELRKIAARPRRRGAGDGRAAGDRRGRRAATTLSLEGLRGQVLCSAARDRDARLLVVGAHGWDRIGRLIHGSVSTYVLHHAACPVLVVHGDDVTA